MLRTNLVGPYAMAAAAVGAADGPPAPIVSTSHEKPGDAGQPHRPRRGPGRQG
jgi:hypothetical protein